MTNLAQHPQVVALLARARLHTTSGSPVEEFIFERAELNALLAAIVSALAEEEAGLNFQVENVCRALNTQHRAKVSRLVAEIERLKAENGRLRAGASRKPRNS